MEGFEYSRFMCINLWRVINDPPEDWPLAICVGRESAENRTVLYFK